MTPEQHYERGLELLSNADWCRGHAQGAEAQVDAVVAQAHFGAAAAGTAMRAMELMTHPPRTLQGQRAGADRQAGGTEGA